MSGEITFLVSFPSEPPLYWIPQFSLSDQAAEKNVENNKFN